MHFFFNVITPFFFLSYEYVLQVSNTGVSCLHATSKMEHYLISVMNLMRILFLLDIYIYILSSAKKIYTSIIRLFFSLQDSHFLFWRNEKKEGDGCCLCRCTFNLTNDISRCQHMSISSSSAYVNTCLSLLFFCLCQQI